MRLEKEKEGSVRGDLIEANREVLFMNSNNSRSNVVTPIRSGQSGNVCNTFQKETCNKSPSDMTIYAPAFAAKTPEKQLPPGELIHSNYSPVVNKITEFLKQMRIHTTNHANHVVDDGEREGLCTQQSAAR